MALSMCWLLEQVSKQRPRACVGWVLLSLELERRQQPVDVPALVSLLVA